MRIGYIRVSTGEQNAARQEELMEALGAEKVFADTASGKDAARPGLAAMLAYAREGDTVIVESYSRLARSTRDLPATVEELGGKRVETISHKEGLDTSTPAGRLMPAIFAGLSQSGRECMLERQREGIEIAKRAGKHKGRRPVAYGKARLKALYPEWKAGKITAVSMQRQLGLSASTFYRRVAELEREIADA
jgi:DNA invertase Pin-like site-specific DNA recombinase